MSQSLDNLTTSENSTLEKEENVSGTVILLLKLSRKFYPPSLMCIMIFICLFDSTKICDVLRKTLKKIKIMFSTIYCVLVVQESQISFPVG